MELGLIDARFEELDMGYKWMVNFLKGRNSEENLG